MRAEVTVKPCVRWETYGRYVANMIERYVLGSDGAIATVAICGWAYYYYWYYYYYL